MILELKRIDISDNNNEIYRFGNGQHILGRSDFKCIDKRISRRHLQLDINNDEDIQLTSLHQNLCFYKLTEDSPQEITKAGVPTNVSSSEYIGLLPDAFWFKITKLNDCDNDSTNPSEQNSKINTQEGDLTTTLLNNNENENSNTDSTKTDEDCTAPKRIKLSDSPIDVKPNVEALQASLDQPSSSTADVESNVKVEPDISAVKTEGPSGSDQSPVKTESRPIRDRCTYGSSCYRKNPQHKLDNSHPGDADWDNQATCPWGAACYRQNPQHRKDFYHPGPPAPRPQPQPQQDFERRRMCLERHGKILMITANTVNVYDDHVHLENSDGESEDYSYDSGYE